MNSLRGRSRLFPDVLIRFVLTHLTYAEALNLGDQVGHRNTLIIT